MGRPGTGVQKSVYVTVMLLWGYSVVSLSSHAAEIGTSYYAVAVVKRSSNITMGSLKGARSCHTGINRTAGWDVPVGHLTDTGHLAPMGCDLPQGKAYRANIPSAMLSQ